MKKITVWNRKGGVGKTTIAINLAYELFRKGKKVLCLDLDSQANLTSFFEKDMQKKGKALPDLGRVLDANMNFFHLPETDRIIRKAIYSSRYPGMDFIRGNKTMETIAGDSFRLLDELLNELEYDICILDCHPDFSWLSQNAVYAADLVLVPVLLDGFSRDNLNLVAEDILHLEEQAGYEIPFAAVANRVMNRKSQRRIFEDLIYRHDYPVLGTCIRDYAVVGNALLMKKPVSEHRKSSPPARDFADLAEEITERTEKGKGAA